MPAMDAWTIYSHFLREVASSRQVWCLKCHHNEVCAVPGTATRFILPLWHDAENAWYYTSIYWPDHQPFSLPVEDLLCCCLVAADRSDIPAGIGLAPDPQAVIVPARQLRLDLIESLRLTRSRL